MILAAQRINNERIMNHTKYTLFIAFLMTLMPVTAISQDRVSKFVENAKDKATRNLKDPLSAQFRDLEVREKVGNEGKKYLYLCGELNAKNQMGGYVGFKKFYSSEIDVRIIDINKDDPTFEMISLVYSFACGTDTKLIRKVK